MKCICRATILGKCKIDCFHSKYHERAATCFIECDIEENNTIDKFKCMTVFEAIMIKAINETDKR